MTRFTLRILTLFAFTLAISMAAQAQAPRTWVQATGDDINPCSRTAPCKTFAGAISKTNVDGEIDVIDAGGYGTVTITKSITIDGAGTFASILASGLNGVVINLTTTSTSDPKHAVRLRNLSINGTGTCAAPCTGTSTGLNGISIATSTASATSVFVENVVIDGFTQNGINATFSTDGNLSVVDSVIRNTAIGIRVSATAGFGVANIVNSHINRNTTGVNAQGNGVVTITRSEIARNTGDGVKASSATNCLLTVQDSVIAHNDGIGINASVVGASIRTMSNWIIGNGTGINAVGTVQTDGQNRSALNGVPGAPNGGLVTIQ